jgi:hypothetical protein
MHIKTNQALPGNPSDLLRLTAGRQAAQEKLHFQRQQKTMSSGKNSVPSKRSLLVLLDQNISLRHTLGQLPSCTKQTEIIHKRDGRGEMIEVNRDPCHPWLINMDPQL